MSPFVAVVICGLLALPAGASSSVAPRGLVRDAARLSGLRVRHAVQAVTVSHARSSAASYPAEYAQLGLVGVAAKPPSPRAWYDVSARRLFVQRAPAPARRTLIHELVRALIDQNYGLRRMARLRLRDRDRWLAAQGIVDGTAALASGLRPARVAGTPLQRFSQLEASTGLGPGRALAAELRYLGGRTALTSALRTFPQTTEQLLHVDKFLQREPALAVNLPHQAGAAALSASQTFGELEVRNFLQAFDVPTAATTAAGWGGGRLAVYGGVAVLVLRWDSSDDALEWQDAVPQYVTAAFGGAAARDCPPLDSCWSSGATEIAAGVFGSTSVLASGADSDKVAAALLTLK